MKKMALKHLNFFHFIQNPVTQVTWIRLFKYLVFKLCSKYISVLWQSAISNIYISALNK